MTRSTKCIKDKNREAQQIKTRKELEDENKTDDDESSGSLLITNRNRMTKVN